MDLQESSTRLNEIICDKLTFQKLQNLEENETVKFNLFPFRTKQSNLLRFIVLDMSKCKVNQSTKKSLYNQEQFIKTASQILSGVIASQILVYYFTKQSIDELLRPESSVVKIVCLDARQINQVVKNCVIVSFKLPNNFYEQQDAVFNLEGYKFNAIGQRRQNWGFINNGRVTKDIFGLDNQKVRKQLQKNTLYSKNQLKSILELINKANSSTFLPNEKLKLGEELSLLGQNFIHHQKFIINSNNLLPVINFEIELVCSMGRGESCKNDIGTQNILNFERGFQNLCLNFADGVEDCLKAVNSKIERIFNREKQPNYFFTLAKDLNMTTMPTKMVNPHFFLKTETKDKFSQYYVKGLYEYYHYGDHNFNDQGWGCAYRSLESLLSWFRLQQKLHLHTVPTVPEIQNIIDLIDCTSEQKLSNSKNWIGATEVSWVVKKLTGFDCRILHIKDGKDIVEHAQMFREHLQNVGTPIMYGGDEYAYSIVGINYSWKLGEIMFCILDPHYNGSDKIEKIIEKKGVCWRKPEEMFKKGVFYNFCLPIL